MSHVMQPRVVLREHSTYLNTEMHRERRNGLYSPSFHSASIRTQDGNNLVFTVPTRYTDLEYVGSGAQGYVWYVEYAFIC